MEKAIKETTAIRRLMLLIALAFYALVNILFIGYVQDADIDNTVKNMIYLKQISDILLMLLFIFICSTLYMIAKSINPR